MSSSELIADDVRKAQTTFNKGFGGLIRQFYSTELRVEMKVFTSICKPVFGAGLWYDKMKVFMALKNMGVSYHSAIKKILGLPRFYSNHQACNLLCIFTFDHYLNCRSLEVYRSLNRRSSPCLLDFHLYFRKFSCFTPI